MSPHIPVTLKGANLGERHRHLNSLVTEAFNAREPFESSIMLAESSPVDRLFKIDLASKYKNLDYIVKCLQDDDMLYVSRALKSKWLFDEQYRHIINPTYLEDVLYPHMITTAVSKMKHWVYLNMRDSLRCQEFYEYYFEKDCNYAFKFLNKCPVDLILNEFPKKVVLNQITPHRFKMLCERNPAIAKIYFDLFKNDTAMTKLHPEKKYFDTLKFIKKSDANTFLDTIEKHFLSHYKRLSKLSTKYIITHHKDRFMQKPELYTARILNIDTLAQCLTQDECEELVIALARARYLESKERWFNYKNVEPLVKRLDPEKRSSIKKKVFEDKDVGEFVDDWPYALPTPLVHVSENNTIDIFLDKEESPEEYGSTMRRYKCLKRSQRMLCYALSNLGMMPKQKKTFLESLFDEYRFTGFEKTLFELRKKIKCESSSQNRMNMMLVLVSKTGGKMESLDALFQLLMKHRNEPSQVRAAVIRSLVKRAFVWRASDDIWRKLLIFGKGLGLDGGSAEAGCSEGLHAVVIRTLLSNRILDPSINISYIQKFSTLTNYSLTMREKQHISHILLNILLETANAETNAYHASKILNYALDTLQAYHIKFETCPAIVNCIKDLVQKDQAAGKGILKRLFKSKLGRKELFKENFDLLQTNASYLNALKHDISILSGEKFVKAVVSDKLNAELFIRKVSIYFNQNNDLASDLLTALKEAKIHKRLARPLAYLIGDNLNSYILELETTQCAETKRYSARVKANLHVTRPVFSIDCQEWHLISVKMIANIALKCRSIDVDRFINKLLTGKRTAKLAIVLSQRTNYQTDVIAAVAKTRPLIALMSALKYFRRLGDYADLTIWETVKPLIVKFKDMTVGKHRLLCKIKKIEWIPLSIRPEYATETFKAINEIDFDGSLSVLCHIIILLPNIEEDFIEAVLCDFIQNRFTDMVNSSSNHYYNDKIIQLFMKVFSKYLLLCKTYDTQKRRIEKVGQLYLNHLKTFWDSTEDKSRFFRHLNTVINAFKYHKAFLNDNYVSCLPVMEKFEKWMQTFLPMEKYICYYIPLHFTMLYYKAVRQAVDQMSDVFVNESKKRNEAYKLVGENFGKHISLRVKILTEKYFSSIVMLYNEGLVDYVRSFNQGRAWIVPYIIIGIVKVSDGIECSLAISLYNDNVNFFNEEKREEIIQSLRQNNQIEMQFYYNNNGFLNMPFRPTRR